MQMLPENKDGHFKVGWAEKLDNFQHKKMKAICVESNNFMEFYASFWGHSFDEIASYELIENWFHQGERVLPPFVWRKNF